MDEKSWSQTSLPVCFGGLELRRVVDVSFRAFASYVRATSSLVGALTSRVNGLVATTVLVEAGTLWRELSGETELLTAESSLK